MNWSTSHFRQQVACLLFLFLAATAVPVPAADQTDGLLGMESAAVVLEGSIEQLGVSGTIRLVLGRDGRIIKTVGSRLGNTLAFNGERAWETDWNGITRDLTLAEWDQIRLMGHLLSGAWSRNPEELSGCVPGEVETTESGRKRHSFTMGDRGMTGWVDIDPESGHMVGLGVDHPLDGVVVELLDYRLMNGAWYPEAMTWTFREGETERMEFRKALAEDKSPEMTVPSNDGRGAFRFASDASAELEVVRAPTGHLLVHPVVDGGDAGWFIFDTGAGANVIDNATAGKLGMEPFGSVSAAGVGGTVTSGFYGGSSLGLGALTLERPIYVGLDLAFLDGVMGRKIAGIIGYGMLTRAVIALELEAGTISLYDPDSFVLEKGRWQEMDLYNRHPNVKAYLEYHEITVKLDTGAPGTVSMHTPTVEKLDLLNGRKTTSTAMGGVGGQVAGRSGQVSSFILGGHRFAKPTIEFATEAKGVFNDAYIDGNVGGQFLRPFCVIFDYPHRRIAFLPATS